MTRTYSLTSERNRNIIVSSNKIDDLRAVRDKLNKIDKDYIKTTDIKINAVNFEIVESGK